MAAVVARVPFVEDLADDSPLFEVDVGSQPGFVAEVFVDHNSFQVTLLPPVLLFQMDFFDDLAVHIGNDPFAFPLADVWIEQAAHVDPVVGFERGSCIYWGCPSQEEQQKELGVCQAHGF